MAATNILSIFFKKTSPAGNPPALKLLPIVFIIIGFTFSFNKANAQISYVWTGTGGNTLWTNVNNWSGCGGCGYPGQIFADNITIPAGANINLAAGTTINGSITAVTVTGAATLTLGRALTVTGAVTVNSTCTVNGNFLLTAASLSTAGSGTTLTLNGPTTITGNLDIGANTTLTKGSTGVITGNTLSTGASSTLTLGNTATFSGAITINGTTTESGSTLSGASLATANSSTVFNANGALTITGLTSIGANTTLSKGSTGTFTANTLTTAASSALTLGLNTTFTGAVNVNGSTTFTGSTLTAPSLTLANAATVLTANAALTITGATSLGASTSITKGATGVFTGNTLTTASSSALSLSNNATFSGAITVNGSTTVSGSSTLQGASLTTATSGTVLTANSPLTITGATSIAASTSITKGATGVFTGNTLTTAGTTSLTLNNAATFSGAIAVNGNTTFGGGSLLTGASVTVASSTTATLNTPLTTGGTIALSGSGSVLTSNSVGVVNAANLTMAASSTYNIGGTGTVTGTTTINGNATIAGAATLSTANLNIPGSYTLTENANINIANRYTVTDNTATIINIGSTFALNANGAITIGSSNTTSLTLQGAGAMNITGSNVMNQNTTFAISGTDVVTFAAGSSLSLNNTCSVTNTSGTINFAGTSASPCTFTPGQDAVITNGGTFTGTYVTMNAANGNADVINTGTFSLSNSTYTPKQNGSFTSSGTTTFTASTLTLTDNATPLTSTAGTTTLTGCTVALGGSGGLINTSGTGNFRINGGSTVNIGGSNSTAIEAAGTGTYTIDGGSTINLTAFGAQVRNTGTMICGTSGSSCIINMNNQPNGQTTGANVYNTGNFTLGSTSIIYFGSSFQQTINNTGTFTLKSDANGSAAIGPKSTSVNDQLISGSYVVERFFTGGLSAANRGYRLLSSPVSLSSTLNYTGNRWVSNPANTYSLNNIKNGAFTGGIGGTGSGFSGTSIGPTLYLYKETLPASTSTSNFIAGKHVGISAVTATTVTTLHATDPTVTVGIPIGNGFLFYFVGNNTRTTGGSSGGPPQDATISNSGYINQGTFTVNLWYGTAGLLSASAASNPGYCMLGNPYPSSINLATVISDNSGVVNNAYVLNSRTGGTAQDYIAYSSSGGTSSPLFPQYVVSGGGFLVHATSAGAFNFNEAQKAPAIQLTGSAFIMSAPKAEVLTVDGKLGNNGLTIAQQKTLALPPQTAAQPLTGLYMKMEKDTAIFSYCGIYFKNNSSAKFDNDDALYVAGPTTPVNMSSMSADGVATAINSLPDYHNGSRVWLRVNATTTGLYNLKLEGVRNIDDIYDIYLLDHLKKDSLDIRRYGTYSFNLNTADTTTYGSKRFELAIRLKPLPQYLLTNFTGNKITEGVNVSWKTVNESNYTGFTLEKLNKTTLAYESVYEKQSDGSAAYAYIDHFPTSGINTYRLKQNDVAGRISYTQPVTVFYDKLAGNGILNVFPNPTAEVINVSIPGNVVSPGYKLRVYNSSGNLVLQKTTATQYWTENIGHLKTGAYVVEVEKNDGTSLGKVKFVKN